MKRPALSFGISCLHFDWETVPQAFTRAQDEFHLGSIEFSTNRVDASQYAQCKQLSADTGMGVGLHVWDNFAGLGVADGIEAMERNLAICVQMAAKHQVAHFGSNPSRADGVKIVAHICRAVADDYLAAGVTICLENHYLYEYGGKNEIGGEPADFHAVFAEAGSPAVKFCLDYGHSHMSNNTTAFIDELSGSLAYTHIADNMGEHDDHLAFGEGTVDWAEEMRHTLAAGFRGPYVIEFPEWRCGAARFADFVALVRGLDEDAGG